MDAMGSVTLEIQVDTSTSSNQVSGVLPTIYVTAPNVTGIKVINAASGNINLMANLTQSDFTSRAAYQGAVLSSDYNTPDNQTTVANAVRNLIGNVHASDGTDTAAAGASGTGSISRNCFSVAIGDSKVTRTAMTQQEAETRIQGFASPKDGIFSDIGDFLKNVVNGGEDIIDVTLKKIEKDLEKSL